MSSDNTLLASLKLHVFRSNGSDETFYVHDGLRIGRSVANEITLADDQEVEQHHARIHVSDQGVVVLKTLRPGSFIRTETDSRGEIPLHVGTRFKIGKTVFECRKGSMLSPEPANSRPSEYFTPNHENDWPDKITFDSFLQRDVVPIGDKQFVTSGNQLTNIKPTNDPESSGPVPADMIETAGEPLGVSEPSVSPPLESGERSNENVEERGPRHKLGSDEPVSSGVLAITGGVAGLAVGVLCSFFMDLDWRITGLIGVWVGAVAGAISRQT